ncbi:MAG TPA: class I SAM-dependent methyltransferase, partial [Flavitalea sp.]|nr:class I SAM-dependent methyltransferase [Flavitalea sp.]
MRTNEQKVKVAFDRQAPVFDSLYANDEIICYKRQRVREHVLKHIKKKSSILELNAGTGDDALFFARQGHSVYATDLSPEMFCIRQEKVKQSGLEHVITNEICSYTELHNLHNKGPFDLIFSNFAGLNCTNKLPSVLKDLIPLVKPGGLITLVLLPPFCLWETLLFFKGKWKTAS